MTTEIVLFLLRMVSGLLLISLLVSLFVIMWRDYRSAVEQVSATRRTFGQFIEMRHLDDSLAITGKTYPLFAYTSLGRAPTNAIHIEDSFASAEHAIVFMRNGQWWLEDRISRNGTLLNNVPVTQPVVITHGDIIGIGSMSFRLELE